MVRDEGDDAALADDPGDGPDDGARHGRGGRGDRATNRSYFFRTHLDESGGALPALPPPDPADDGLDPSDTLYDDPDPGAGGPLRSYRSVDPNATLRHGAGLIIPPEAQPLPADPDDDHDLAHGSPLRPARSTRRASDEAPLPSLEELEEMVGDPEATTWGDEDDDLDAGRADDDDDDDDDLITELAPSIVPSSDEPPFEGPPELGDELQAAREALERATRPSPPPPSAPDPAPVAPVAPVGDRTTTRATSRLPLTLVGGDAEAQRLVRDAIARAAERVAGPDGAVTWRVPMGALVEALRETLPDPRQEEIARLEEALTEARGVIDEARARAATLERELGEARGRTARLEGGATRLDRELADVRARVAALERELTDTRTRAARLDEGLARARERQGEAEREAAALRQAQAALVAERDEARERAAAMDDDLTLLREEVAGLERESTSARDQATNLEAELQAVREQLAEVSAERDEAAGRGRNLEARLAAEERVVERARQERDAARDELVAAQDELAGARATAARELATLSREHHDARRALERELEAQRAERVRFEELLLVLLGELPDDEDDPLARPAHGPRPASGAAPDPRRTLAALRALVARLGRLEGDRRHAALLPVPPFDDLLARLAALREQRPELAPLEARCRAGRARYAELRARLRRREAATRHLVELSAVVREALVLEEVLDTLAQFVDTP